MGLGIKNKNLRRKLLLDVSLFILHDFLGSKMATGIFFDRNGKSFCKDKQARATILANYIVLADYSE